jgi:hypothetical protein
MQQNTQTKAERDRAAKEAFMRQPCPKWERNKHHPLYAWFDTGDMMRCVEPLKTRTGKPLSRNYLSNMLTGVIDWTPMEGDRGDTKRKIMWRVKEYVWALMQTPERKPPPPEKKARMVTNLKNKLKPPLSLKGGEQ